jgi:hypothetical protein
VAKHATTYNPQWPTPEVEDLSARIRRDEPRRPIPAHRGKSAPVSAKAANAARVASPPSV